mgnify:FL=1|tara:strand:+ start:50 stop:283 length:234 start_codon:yes stop_codon:yes gene_type:complete
MSRQYNAAREAYRRMDIEGFEKLETIKEPEKTGGLLARSNNNMSKSSDSLDYTNPAVRVAKQMQVIRKYRGEINGDE